MNPDDPQDRADAIRARLASLDSACETIDLHLTLLTDDVDQAWSRYEETGDDRAYEIYRERYVELKTLFDTSDLDAIAAEQSALADELRAIEGPKRFFVTGASILHGQREVRVVEIDDLATRMVIEDEAGTREDFTWVGGDLGWMASVTIEELIALKDGPWIEYDGSSDEELRRFLTGDDRG